MLLKDCYRQSYGSMEDLERSCYERGLSVGESVIKKFEDNLGRVEDV